MTAAGRRRSSRRLNFIPPLVGVRASWDHVLEAAASVEEAEQIARTARATYRIHEDGHSDVPKIMQGPAEAIAEIPVGKFDTVRRPVSYQGMTHYIGRVSVVNEHGPVGVWTESLNEMSHLRDLCLTRAVRSVMTQPFRIEFIFERGLRHHVPDFLIELDDGQRLLVDVTREAIAEREQQRATFALTAAVASRLGWAYEVRTEMAGAGSQRERNLNFLWTYREHGDDDSWEPGLGRKLASALPLPIHEASRRLGMGTDGLRAVWQALARQRVFTNLNEPIQPWSTLSRGPVECAQPWVRSW